MSALLTPPKRSSSTMGPYPEPAGLYGQPKPPYLPPDPSRYPEAVLSALPLINQKAARALMCGIASLVLGILAGIPAVVYGHLALREIRRSHHEQRGQLQAVAGLVLGYCSPFLTALYIVLFSGTLH